MEFLSATHQTLAATEATLRAALDGLDHSALTERPAPGEWAVVEVLCHLRDLEREVFPARTALIRRNDASPIAGFDPEAWARERGYARDDPHQALEAFSAARRANLLVIKSIAAEELASTARHSEFGVLSLRALLADWAGSDLVHTAQIQRIRLWRFYPEMGPFQQYFRNALRLG